MCGSRERVLIVDDERNIADTLVLILRGEGYQASAAYDGCDAILQAIDLKPGLVISDVYMPNLNGIDTVIQIQAIIPDCKVLLFSGQATMARLLAESRSQARDFEVLEKPMRPQELIERIRTAMRRPEDLVEMN